MFSHLHLFYQTGSDLTAPHAYEVEIACTPSPEGLEVDFKQLYIGRSDLDKQEIEAEGFTDDDDFIWKGIIPNIWTRMLESQLKSTQLAKQASERLHIELDENGDKKKGAPQPESAWIALVEQLTQACLEAGGKELSMELVLGRLEKNDFYEKGRLIWSFASRTLTGQILNGKARKFSELDWSQSQISLKNAIEHEAQFGDLYQIPTYKGLFWLLNGEVWLSYGVGADIPAIQWIEDELGM